MTGNYAVAVLRIAFDPTPAQDISLTEWAGKTMKRQSTASPLRFVPLAHFIGIFEKVNGERTIFCVKIASIAGNDCCAADGTGFQL